jgi:hypothetical protein
VSSGAGKETVLVREGMIECRWPPGTVLDVDDVRDALRALAQATGGRPMPGLFHMTDVATTAAARHLLAQVRHFTAIAVLGSGPVDRVRAAAAHRHAVCPARFFTSQTDAEAWLSGLPKPDEAGRRSEPRAASFPAPGAFPAEPAHESALKG